MANTQRYKPEGEWHHRASWAGFVQLADGNDDRADIIVEQADLRERHTGRVYSGGAFRVVLKNVPGMRTKSFYGEVAHHAAASYAHDAANKCGDWRWWPGL